MSITMRGSSDELELGSCSFITLPQHTTNQTLVTCYEAVVADSGQLTHCGSFVRVKENENVCVRR